MSSFNLYDFNFGDDGGGPDTDPTPIEGALEQDSLFSSADEPLPEDTMNYAEPGEGSSFAGQDPSVWEGRGNPERPEQWDGVVPPVETQDTQRTTSRERKLALALTRARPDYDRMLAYKFAKYKERTPNKRYVDFVDPNFDLDMLDSTLDVDDNESDDPGPDNTNDFEQEVDLTSVGLESLIEDIDQILETEGEAATDPEPEEVKSTVEPVEQDDREEIEHQERINNEILRLFNPQQAATLYIADLTTNAVYTLLGLSSGLFESPMTDEGVDRALTGILLDDFIEYKEEQLFDIDEEDATVPFTGFGDIEYELERIVGNDFDLFISDFENFESPTNFLDEFDFVVE